MNIETIEAIKACISHLNHIKGAVVIRVDSDSAHGSLCHRAEIRVPEGKESLLSYLEQLSKTLGHLNGEGLYTEINLQRRILFLS
jgi:hypothetical protein